MGSNLRYVDCTTCNIGIQCILTLTNNADPFSSRLFILNSRNNNFYGKGSKKKKPGEDDGTVTISYLAEVFKSSSGTDSQTTCPTQDEPLHRRHKTSNTCFESKLCAQV
mmetsp:Transcript_1149/g.2546  ORF Transcript_1149/g.2546 Transcript_1149/m.2546 type:complete len:109 (-) Transcript_1149:1676-2002(-)